MHKYSTILIMLLVAVTVFVGCGKKEVPLSETQITMPMSVNVEGAPTTPATNLITKAGTPIEIREAPATEEPTPIASYTAPSVEDIQQALKNAGLYTGAIDGKTGPITKKAITEFQQQNGLTADGKVGRKTWEKLKVYSNQEEQ